MTTPYRDDVDALETELARLETELARIDQGRRAVAEAAEREASMRERADDIRRRLRMRRRTLPMLDGVRIATPCHADWDSMIGDERVRFCSSCQKNVFDLSGMTRNEAEGFLRERFATGADTCVRFYQRADGTVLTSDCPVGVSRSRRRKVAAAAFGATVAAAGAAFGFSPGNATRSAQKLPPAPHVTVQEDIRPLMGAVARPWPTPSADPKPGPRGGRDRAR